MYIFTVPPEDEGWLCPVCECKMECLDVVNAYLGTAYSLDDHWQVHILNMQVEV